MLKKRRDVSEKRGVLETGCVRKEKVGYRSSVLARVAG